MKRESLKNFLILIPLVLLILIVSIFYIRWKNSGGQISENYEKLISEADSLYQSREYNEAYSKYQEALEKDPKEADAYYGINFILLDKGLNDKAMELMISAEENLSGEDISMLYMQIGDEFANDQEWNDAIQNYLKANIADSGNEDATKGLFISYLKVGDIEAANSMKSSVEDLDLKEFDYLNRYDELLTEEDKDLYKVVEEATIFINDGYPYLAVEPIIQIEEQAAEYWDAWYLLGKAYYEIGEITSVEENYDNANDALDKAVLLGSEDPGLYLLLARINYQDKQINTAYIYYDRSYAYAEDQFKELVGKEYTDILLDENSLSKAVEIAQSESDLEDFEENPLAFWRYLVNLRAYTLNDEVESLGELIETAPEDLKMSRDYLLILGRYYLDKKNSEKAEPLISTLKSLDQFDPQYFLYQAELNMLNDNPEDAILNLEKSIEYDLIGESTPAAKSLLQELEQ